MPDFVIRRGSNEDLPQLGHLAALLLRTHVAFDPLRFMSGGARVEDGYAWFLGTQLEQQDVAVFVAERGGTILGYAYVAIEPQSWKDLRDEAGFVHDLVVDESSRGMGVGSALMDAAFDWFRERGAPRVVLGTADANTGAQRLFARLGFRRTMIEMTKEL